MAITIVLGYDGSDCAKAALQRVTGLAGLVQGSRVVVTYAYSVSIGYVPPGMTDSPLMMGAALDDHVRLLEQAGRERVDEAATTLRAAGITAETVVSAAAPVDALLEAAEAHGADYICVGTHGEGAVSAALLGSTALKLLHRSEVPVLVVPRHDRR